MRALPRRQQVMLERQTDIEGLLHDDQRSEMAKSVINSMVMRGWSDADIFAVLQDPRNKMVSDYIMCRRLRKNSDKTKLRSGTQQIALIRREIEETRQWIELNPTATSASDVQQRIDEVVRAITETQWGGRTGSSDYLVLSTLVRYAQTSNSIVVGTHGIRSLSVDSGVSIMTARAALQRLVSSGWLSLGIKSDGIKSDTYNLLVPSVSNRSLITSTLESPFPGTGPSVLATRLASEDAFAWKALGRTPARIMDLLGERKLTASELIELSGLSKATVYKGLAKLQDNELVIASDGVYERLDGGVAVDEQLQEIAELYETAGRKDRVMAQHEWERLRHMNKQIGKLLGMWVDHNVMVIDPTTMDIHDRVSGQHYGNVRVLMESTR